jgi:hypothetical protein
MYIDVDVRSTRPIADWAQAYKITDKDIKFVVGWEWPHWEDPFRVQFQQWTLISVARNPILELVLQRIEDMLEREKEHPFDLDSEELQVLSRTGPSRFTSSIMDYLSTHARPLGSYVVKESRKFYKNQNEAVVAYSVANPLKVQEKGQIISFLVDDGANGTPFKMWIAPYKAFGFFKVHESQYNFTQELIDGPQLVQHQFSGSWKTEASHWKRSEFQVLFNTTCNKSTSCSGCECPSGQTCVEKAPVCRQKCSSSNECKNNYICKALYCQKCTGDNECVVGKKNKCYAKDYCTEPTPNVTNIGEVFNVPSMQQDFITQVSDGLIVLGYDGAVTSTSAATEEEEGVVKYQLSISCVAANCENPCGGKLESLTAREHGVPTNYMKCGILAAKKRGSQGTLNVQMSIQVPEEEENSLSSGAIAGIIVGSICGVILIVAIVGVAVFLIKDSNDLERA